MKDREVAKITVGEVLGFEDLPQLAVAVREGLEQAAGVELEVRTAEVNLGMLQLVCSAHRTAAAAGKTFSVAWEEGRERISAITQAGFSRHVACPRSTTGECLWVAGEEP